MPKIVIYATPLDNPYAYSLFGKKPDPRKQARAERLYREETRDSGGRPISIVKYDGSGKPSYTLEARYDGCRLVEQREEFVETGAVVRRLYSYDGAGETVRVLFDGELDETIIREYDADGRPVMERVEDARGTLKRLSKWNSDGVAVYEETPEGARSFEIRGEGEDRMEVSTLPDGTETWEKKRSPRQGVEETELYIAGELSRKIVEETVGARTTVTGTEEGVQFCRGFRERDSDGRVVRSEYAERVQESHRARVRQDG